MNIIEMNERDRLSKEIESFSNKIKNIKSNGNFRIKNKIS